MHLRWSHPCRRVLSVRNKTNKARMHLLHQRWCKERRNGWDFSPHAPALSVSLIFEDARSFLCTTSGEEDASPFHLWWTGTKEAVRRWSAPLLRHRSTREMHLRCKRQYTVFPTTSPFHFSSFLRCTPHAALHALSSSATRDERWKGDVLPPVYCIPFFTSSMYNLRTLLHQRCVHLIESSRCTPHAAFLHRRVSRSVRRCIALPSSATRDERCKERCIPFGGPGPGVKKMHTPLVKKRTVSMHAPLV